MSKVSFFTPVEYINPKKSAIEKCREKVDAYFHWRGKKAYIIKDGSGKEKAVLRDAPVSILSTAAKVLSCFTIVIPLIMLAAKAALRLFYAVKLVDPEKKLGKGMELAGAKEEIERLMPQIIGGEDNAAIEWLGKGNNRVFKLQTHPGLVFKTVTRRNGGVLRNGKMLRCESMMKERFASSLEAYTVKAIHQLGLLIIPKTKIFDINYQGNVYQVIAEESLDFNPSASAQERNYELLDGLDESVSQLSRFIAEFKFNDVTPRNVPILNESPQYLGSRRIGLIDIEHRESAIDGFIGGGNGSCGLIGTVGPRHVDAVIESARSYVPGIRESDLQSSRQRRLEQLEERNRLYQFYTDRGVVNGSEHVNIDHAALAIDLNEQAEVEVERMENGELVSERIPVTMNMAVNLMSAHINASIANSRENDTPHRRRLIPINTSSGLFRAFAQAGNPVHGSSREERDNRNWIKRVGRALIDAGYAFKQGEINGVDYIQV